MFDRTSKKVHAMDSKQASGKKLTGHKNEADFNACFGDKDAAINYGPSSDCEITDKSVLDMLKKRLNIKSPKVSVKGGDTI